MPVLFSSCSLPACPVLFLENYAEQEQTTPGDVVTFSYDVLGRRVAKKHDAVSELLDKEEYYTLTGDQIALVQRTSGDPDAEFSTTRLMWGAAVDQLLAMEETLEGEFKFPVWTLPDHQGTIRDFVGRQPGQASQLLRTRDYNAFGLPGHSKNWDESITDQFFNELGSISFLYTGRDYDEETGLQYNRARYYDPISRSFISEDPIGGGDANFYRYVGNSPMNATDPSGNVICGGVCLGIAAVALLSATGWLGTEIALAPDSGEAFDAGLGGVGAGAVNIADVFTWNQIDTLHTYRNRRFDELGITGTWTDTIATGGAIAARESLITLATLGTAHYARATAGAVAYGGRALHYGSRTAAIAGSLYEFATSTVDVGQGAYRIGHGIYTKNWQEVTTGGLQLGLGGLGFYGGGRALGETLSISPRSGAGVVDDAFRTGDHVLDAQIFTLRKELGQLSVYSPKDKALFWSGSVKEARAVALREGRVTLEMTDAGKYLANHPLVDKIPARVELQLWKELSSRFAHSAIGQVKVLRTSVTSSSVFSTLEHSILWKRYRKGVTQIIIDR